jgi:hypothetical protein
MSRYVLKYSLQIIEDSPQEVRTIMVTGTYQF